MTKVLVLSRNAAIAMGLATAEIDVIDCRPDSSDTWMDDAADVDVIVVQPDATFNAAEAVHKLRAQSTGARAVVIQPAGADWPSSEESERYAVERLSLPLSLPLLLQEVHRLAALPSVTLSPRLVPEPAGAPPDAPIEATEADVDEVVEDESADEAVEEESARDGGDVDEDTLNEPVLVVADQEPTQAEAEASNGQVFDPLTAPLETLVVGEPSRWLLGQWSPPNTPASLSPAASADATNDVASPRSAPSAPQLDLDGDIGTLVSALLAKRADLSSLAEVAEIVLSECTPGTGAEAGALLCRDGEVWRVAAGIGLRPLEHRYQLEPAHWLVRTLQLDRKAIVVEDTDIARERLHGAPLASWEQIAAVPLGQSEAFVVVARHGEPFDDTSVELIVRVGAEADSLLHEALQLRELARALAPLTDDPSE